MDESGNHGLKTIDPNYPVFCLVACIFEKNFYQNYVREAVDSFKCIYWGRTSIISFRGKGNVYGKR